jgi:type II secretory pathway component HofQ
MLAILAVVAAAAAGAGEGDGAGPPAEKVVQFPALALDPEPPRYTGEPITLSLKDADLRDVIKTFAVLTDINMVVDPSVRGEVTLELSDVPWDQAFELILRINGLDYHLANNVMYIAPPSKLAAVALGR